MIPRLSTGVAVLALLGGCVTSNNPEGPEADAAVTFPETGTTFDSSVPDSSLPPVDSGPAPDVAVPMPDADLIDAPADTSPLPVTVLVTGPAGPESGVPIVFSDASGAVILATTTNAAGTASQLVPAGSQVTAIFGTEALPRLVTVVGVEPGDVLSAFDVGPAPTTVEQVVTTALPPSPPGQVSQYEIAAGACTAYSPQPPWSFSLYPECVSGGQFPLLGLALDEVNNETAYTYQKGNAAFPDAGPTDGGPLSFALGGTWSPAVTFPIAVSNIPGSYYGDVGFTEIAGGVPYQRSFSFSGPGPDGGDQVETLNAHPGYADFVQAEATISAGNLSDAGGYVLSLGSIATRSAGLAADASVAFDLAQLLPFVTGATVDGTTPARPTTTWSTSGSLASADGTIVLLSWDGFDNDAGVSITGHWLFVAPPSATSVQAPLLPATASTFAPTPDATFGTPGVATFDSTLWSGYPQMRAVSATLPPSNVLTNGFSSQPVVPPLPADGTLKMTTYTINGD